MADNEIGNNESSSDIERSDRAAEQFDAHQHSSNRRIRDGRHDCGKPDGGTQRSIDTEQMRKGTSGHSSDNELRGDDTTIER